MPEPIEESLGFDISNALQGIAQIDERLQEVTQRFQVGLADALSTLTGVSVDLAQSVDTSGLTAAVEGAINEAGLGTPVPLEGDTSGIVAAIDDAATTSVPPVPLDGDATGITSAIDEATAVNPIVEVGADVGAAEDAIQGLGGDSVNVDVSVDTANAVDSLDQLGTAAKSAGGEAGLGGLSTVAETVAGAVNLAKGETEGLTGAVGGLSAGAGAAVGAGTAFVAFVASAAHEAANAEVAQKRFNATFGDFAEQVQNVNVNGLTKTFEEIGRISGTSSNSLQDSATKIGQLGQSSGASAPRIAEVVDKITALGATLSVENPRLGDAAQVTTGLTNAFARGGRTLAAYNITLTSHQILQRAMADNVGKSAAELTIFDKAAAGAELTLEKTGNTLGDRFTKGAQSATVQFRAFRTQIEESLSKIGGPLLEPIIASLKAVVPIAITTGEVIGGVARIVLPFAAAIAPAFGLVAAPLHAVGVGLNFVADGVSNIPVPVLAGIAVGITAIGVASGAADGLIVALSGALDFLTGPIGIALAGFAILGGIVGQFAAQEDTAKKSADDLNTALFANVGSVSDFSAAVSNLNANFDKYLTTQGGLEKTAPAVSAAMAKAGVTAGELRNGLTGTAQAYKAVQDRLVGAAPDLRAFGVTQDDLTGSTGRYNRILGAIPAGQRAAADAFRQTTLQLKDLSKGFEEDTEKQLKFLAANGAISTDELNDLLNKLHGGLITVGEALQTAQHDADLFAESQARAALATARSTGELARTIAAFNPAKDSVVEYTASLVKMGISQADADQLAKDQAKSLSDQTDKTVLASAAAQDLTLQFVNGQIGAGQLEGGLFSLGATLSASTAQVSQLTSEISAFSSAVVGALPTAGQAVDAFSQGVQTAFTDVANAGKTSAAGVESAFKALGSAQAAQSTASEAAQRRVDAATAGLARAQAQGDKTTGSAAQNARAALEAAQARLTVLETAGTASVSTIANATATVTKAQEKLNQVLAGGGAAGSSSVASARRTLEAANADLVRAQNTAGDAVAKAQADLVAAQGKGAQAVADAQKALEKAVDPQAFIDKLIAQTKATSDFLVNLRKLTAEGFGALAGELARKGPVVGAALAQALVNDHTKAQAGESAVENLRAAGDAAEAWSKSPQVATQGGAIGHNIANSVNAGIRAGYDLKHPTQTALDTAKVLVAAAEPGLTGVALGVARASVVAFDAEFGRFPTIAEIQSGKAAKALERADLSGPGAKAGKTGADGFGIGVDGLAGKTSDAIKNSQSTWNSQVTIDTAAVARIGGVEVGSGFTNGISAGIRSPGSTAHIVAAASFVAGELVGATKAVLQQKSPSQVGIGIGANFTAAIAQGLEQLSPLQAATVRIGQALTPSLRPQLAAVRAEIVAALNPKLQPIRPVVQLDPAVAAATKASQVLVGVAGATQPAQATAGFPNRDPQHLVNVEHLSVQKETDPFHVATELAWRLG